MSYYIESVYSMLIYYISSMYYANVGYNNNRLCISN